jgi:outer membrane protein OmpA-like peptidoglycan-associated protein
VKELLDAHTEYKLEIAGHTDSTGSEQHNLQLAKSRADAVASYLIQHGLQPNRITTASYGSSKPIATNSTEEGKAQNRRVEFILKK